MAKLARLSDAVDCPICGRRPDIDEIEPTHPGEPLLGWYANCYGQTPYEHNIGANADTKAAVIDAWNKTARTQPEKR